MGHNIFLIILLVMQTNIVTTKYLRQDSYRMDYRLMVYAYLHKHVILHFQFNTFGVINIYKGHAAVSQFASRGPPEKMLKLNGHAMWLVPQVFWPVPGVSGPRHGYGNLQVWWCFLAFSSLAAIGVVLWERKIQPFLIQQCHGTVLCIGEFTLV